MLPLYYAAIYKYKRLMKITNDSKLKVKSNRIIRNRHHHLIES